MKQLMFGLLAFAALGVSAQDSIVLVPMDGGHDAIVIEQAEATAERAPLADTAILENEFDLEERDGIILNLEGRASVFPMVIRGGVAAGLGFFNNRVEVGVDAAGTFVMAGEDGEVFSEVGVYTKIRLRGEGSTYYFRGRAFKIFELNDESADGLEFGIGREFGSANRDSGFVELSFQHVTKPDGSTFVIPYLSMGMRIGKPLTRSRVRYLD